MNLLDETAPLYAAVHHKTKNSHCDLDMILYYIYDIILYVSENDIMALNQTQLDLRSY